MAKPHKLAWNGIDIDTTLGIEQLTNLAHRAAIASTGDPAEGRHRVIPARTSDRQLEYRVSDHDASFRKLMVFHLDLEPTGGRTRAASRIDWYQTTQPMIAGFIPRGGKVMVAHRTYLQFIHHLAREVSTADPLAEITLREGAAPAAAAPASEATDEPVQRPAARPGAFGDTAQIDTVEPGLAAGPEAFGGAGSAATAEPRAAAGQVSRDQAEVAAADRAPAAAPVVESFGPPADPAPVPAGRAPCAPPPLVTAVPGMPARDTPPAAPSEPPGRLAALAEHLFVADEDLHATRIAESGPNARPWLLTLPDGGTVDLVADVVVGRNPAAPPDAAAATPVPLVDPNRSVSKTHALIALRDGLPWVTDLHSTNGSTLTNDAGEALACEPGVALPVGDGWTISFGDYEVAVARRPS